MEGSEIDYFPSPRSLSPANPPPPQPRQASRSHLSPAPQVRTRVIPASPPSNTPITKKEMVGIMTELAQMTRTPSGDAQMIDTIHQEIEDVKSSIDTRFASSDKAHASATTRLSRIETTVVDRWIGHQKEAVALIEMNSTKAREAFDTAVALEKRFDEELHSLHKEMNERIAGLEEFCRQQVHQMKESMEKRFGAGFNDLNNAMRAVKSSSASTDARVAALISAVESIQADLPSAFGRSSGRLTIPSLGHLPGDRLAPSRLSSTSTFQSTSFSPTSPANLATAAAPPVSTSRASSASPGFSFGENPQTTLARQRQSVYGHEKATSSSTGESVTGQQPQIYSPILMHPPNVTPQGDHRHELQENRESGDGPAPGFRHSRSSGDSFGGSRMEED